MKLLLCSEGFSTQTIISKCIELVGKPKDQISVGIINEAFAVESGDKRWTIDNLNSVVNNFGGEVDIINLLALSLPEAEKRFSNLDVIFVVGGHTDYLMSVFNKSGFSKLLPKLLESKVYVGSSAGSMVVGKRISKDAYKVMYGEEKTYGITEYLGLVNLSIIPHLDSPHFPLRKEKLASAIAHHQGIVYGLADDSAVVINGNSIEIIGSNSTRFEGGKLS